MAKIRVFIFLTTILIVGAIGIFTSYYARGYRLNLKTFRFEPNGILVIKSEPDGASVYLNGELKTATNATLSLSPGTYDVEVRRDGFFTWYKRLTIEKEIVTQANVSLFRNVPALSPVTFSGAVSPVSAPDGSKIAFAVLPSKSGTNDKIGLFTMDTYSLPLGFTNNPKRITDGDLTGASFVFSPDGRQIMLTLGASVFLLDSGSFTSQDQRVNVASKKDSILVGWKKDKDTKNINLIASLPDELKDILTRKTLDLAVSPDGSLILYTASSSATLPDNLIRQLPGASTQKQERQIEIGRTYIYDIKEDRNFLITDQDVSINGSLTPAVRFMPDSRHILLADRNKVTIMDYDGTNQQTVYFGLYIAPSAFPFANTTKILILTNLGADSSTPNLYALTIK